MLTEPSKPVCLSSGQRKEETALYLGIVYAASHLLCNIFRVPADHRLWLTIRALLNIVNLLGSSEHITECLRQARRSVAQPLIRSLHR